MSRELREPHQEITSMLPNVDDGLETLRFADAAQRSHENGGGWEEVRSDVRDE
jgi:hypothetical protein